MHDADSQLIEKTFRLFTTKLQAEKAQAVQRSKLTQGGRGYIGKSSGDGLLLGKSIVASAFSLGKALVTGLEEILSTSVDTTPLEGAALADRFKQSLEFAGELAAKAVADYFEPAPIGGISTMDANTVSRVRRDWNTARFELDHVFDLMLRRIQKAKSATVERTKTVRGIDSRVQPVNFGGMSGKEFERLVFEYTLRMGWVKSEWLGEGGSDGGCDIWCTDKDGTTAVFLCANHHPALTYRKANKDLTKLSVLKKRPNKIFLVAGGTVSAPLRTKIKNRTAELGLPECEVWGGFEFESKIRYKDESLLKRAFGGVHFPDADSHIAALPAKTIDSISAEAERLLVAMSKASDGRVLRSESHDGYALSVIDLEVQPDTINPRLRAKWENALSVLGRLGLLEPCGPDIFVITNAGFQHVDRQAARRDSTGEPPSS